MRKRKRSFGTFLDYSPGYLYCSGPVASTMTSFTRNYWQSGPRQKILRGSQALLYSKHMLGSVKNLSLAAGDLRRSPEPYLKARKKVAAADA